MAKTEKYDAFISYRHSEPDSEIAARLQKKLEGFRLPEDIAKKVGRKRLDRIFRDETEFAVENDLTHAIDAALLNSDYLIAICSPEYLKSTWCRKEIESFLRFHDRKHILLVLADGEPQDAFPPEVVYEDLYKIGPDGRPYWTKVQREPLAADCRGENAKERNANIDKAALRLIAAIMGIGYDDLQQRQKQEEYKHTRNRVLIVFGVLVAFLAVCIGFLFRIAGQNVEILNQNEEIARQNEIITLKYADTLAATSDNLLRDGKRTDAVYAARLALSDEKTDNYSELATKALANALGIYDMPDSFGCDSDVQLPCSALGDLVISPSGKYASVKGLDRLRYVVDLNSGTTVLSFDEKDYSYFVFDGEKGFVFRRQENDYVYFDLATGTETDLGISEADFDPNSKGEGYCVKSADSLALYKGSNPLWNINYISEGFPEGGRQDVNVTFINDTNECWIFITDYENRKTFAYVVDMTSGSSRRLLVADNVCFSPVTDGKSIVWVQSEGDGHTLWIMDINSGTKNSKTVSFNYEAFVLNDDVVTVSGEDITILNRSLQEVNRINAGFYLKSYVSSDSIYLLDTSCHLYQIRNGSYDRYDTVPEDNVYSRMMVLRNGKLYAALSGDNHIYTYSFRKSDYMTVTASDFEALTSDYYEWGFIKERPVASSFVGLIMKGETEFPENRIRRVVMCENAGMGLVQLFDGAVHIYDSSSGKKIKTIYSIEGSVSEFYYDRNIGYYYLSSQNVDVYDEDFKNIYSIRNCMLSGIEKQSGAIVVYDLTKGLSGSSTYYSVHPVTYGQLISLADKHLSGYEPDERVKEKYSLD